MAETSLLYTEISNFCGVVFSEARSIEIEKLESFKRDSSLAGQGQLDRKERFNMSW